MATMTLAQAEKLFGIQAPYSLDDVRAVYCKLLDANKPGLFWSSAKRIQATDRNIAINIAYETIKANPCGNQAKADAAPVYENRRARLRAEREAEAAREAELEAARRARLNQFAQAYEAACSRPQTFLRSA